MTEPRSIGPFPNAVQIVAPMDSDLHELLTDPQKGTGTGKLTYHGGNLIAAPKVVNVWLGQVVDPTMTQFSKDVVENGLMDGDLRAYRTMPGRPAAVPGKLLGSASIPTSLPTPAVLDSQLQTILHVALDAGQIPAADATTCYAIFMPPGSQVRFDGDNSPDGSSCTGFCGYHTKSTRGIYYAVLCDNACAGCHGQFTSTQALQMVYAHELCLEWPTDPDGTGWFDDGDGSENADKCAWQGIPWGPVDPATGKPKWMVQPGFTNEHGCGYVSPYVAPSTGGGGTPGHTVPGGVMANLWRFLLRNPNVLALVGLEGLPQGSNEYRMWQWIEANAQLGALQAILDSAAWSAWLEKQPMLVVPNQAARIEAMPQPEVD